MAHNWANFERTKNSYELMARYVMPKFQGLNENRDQSFAWARDNHETFIGAAMNAVGTRIMKHIEEKGTKDISPNILAAAGQKPDEAAE